MQATINSETSRVGSEETPDWSFENTDLTLAKFHHPQVSANHTLDPWSEETIISSIVPAEAKRGEESTPGLDEESSRLATKVLTDKIEEIKQYVTQLQEEQLQWAVQGAEARLHKYYLQAGLFTLLPKSLTRQGIQRPVTSANFEEKMNKARYNYNRVQHELEGTQQVLVGLSEVKQAFEDGAVLPV